MKPVAYISPDLIYMYIFEIQFKKNERKNRIWFSKIF
jgi:hypothetical protein